MSSTPSPPAAPKAGSASRVVIGFIFAAIMVAFMLAGGWIWASAALVISFLAFLELEQLMKAKGYNPSRTIVGLVSFFLFLTAALHKSHWFGPIITLGIILSFFRLVFRAQRAGISDVATTILSFFYIAYFPAHFILLRDLGSEGQSNPLYQAGFGYVFLTTVVLATSDIGAYYTGRAFGKHPLYPAISPKKTREGALLGTLIGVICGTVFSWVIGFPLEHGVILSFILSIVGQLGDLSESMLKRDAGMKDSGALLKSHGGVLDRLDSFLFSGAVAYYYIWWIILGKGLGEEIRTWFTQIGS
jgi:phosphatidate cytidylyltransferase